MESWEITAATRAGFARRRSWLAWLAAPALVVFAAGVVIFDARMTLLAVVAAFFAFAVLSVARRGVDEAAAGAMTVSWDAGRITVAGRDRGRPTAAIRRRDYVRVLFTDRFVTRLWLDDRRDPDALVDLPLAPDDAGGLCEALRTAGIEVHRQSMLARGGGLLVATGLGIVGLVLAKAALGVAAAVVANGLEVGLAALLLVGLFVAARRA